MAERTAPLGTDEQADGHPAVTPDPWPANASFQADGMWIASESTLPETIAKDGCSRTAAEVVVCCQ